MKPERLAVARDSERTVKHTGRPLHNDVVHLWTFDASGRIAGYRHFNETAAELAAWSNKTT